MEYGESAGFNDGKNTDFWITKERTVVPTHVAFEARSRKEVEAFHKAALESGEKDNGAPGYRDYWPGYYAAFAYDPDGHNIEAVWYDYSKVRRKKAKRTKAKHAASARRSAAGTRRKRTSR